MNEPKEMHGGESSKGIVALNGKAPMGGVVVPLYTTDQLTMPGAVFIEAGETQAEFGIRADFVKSDRHASVGARLGGTSLIAWTLIKK